MKTKILFIALAFMGIAVTATAQDIITKKDGSELQAKVTEVTQTEIKYQRFDNLSGPVYTMPKSEIFMIKYQGGMKDVFGMETQAATQSVETQKSEVAPTLCLGLRTHSTLTIYQTLSQTDQPLYNQFKRGNTMNKVGTAIMIPGCVLAGVGFITMIAGIATSVDYDYYDDGYGAIVAGGVLFGVGGSLCVASIPLKVIGKRMKKDAIGTFNSRYCNSQSNVQLNLNINANGAGLAIGF
ncbi:MAG: hypothetical protein LBR75_00320 [Prevotellaceae bacterium]|jgi:hypothetical protein|nr:hypothetical protein [Prevotellaceae bacterium]